MSISFRQSIRWPPAPASEPTSTIVLTSPARRFVDVRVQLHEAAAAAGPRAVDWAFAGTSVAVPVPAATLQRWHEQGHEQEQEQEKELAAVTHMTFHHWVDSRTSAPETVRDEGDMVVRADGLVLETGRMVNPLTGREGDYEEVWRDVEMPSRNTAAGAGGGSPWPVVDKAGAPLPRCIVLQLHDDAARRRGMAILLGAYCQSVLREGVNFTVERWEWAGAGAGAGGWAMTFAEGEGRLLPCREMVTDGRRVVEQGEVVLGDATWKVVESVDS